MSELVMFAGLFLGTFDAFAAEKAPPDKNAIMMSPYEVSAQSVDFAKWIKVGSPHYVLYTDAGFSEATAILADLERLRVGAQRYFSRPIRATMPTVLVMPTSGSDWRKIASKGGVQWSVAVSSPSDKFTDLVLVQYDWQARGPAVIWRAQGRAFMRAMNLDGPFWFLRGAGLLFGSAEVKPDAVVLGRHSSRALVLDRQGWLPWGKFFKVTAKSPEFTRESEIVRYEAQCEVFLHYCVTHPSGEWVEKLIRWVALLEAGREPTEEEFKNVFGRDWKAWQKEMDTYTSTGKYTVMTLNVPPSAVDYTPAQLDLTVREMRELFVISQIMNQNIAASDVALDSLLSKGLKTDSLRELLASACIDRKRPDEAAEQVRQIYEKGTSHPEVLLAMAARRFSEKMPDEPEIDVNLGEATEEIRTLCRRVVDFDPRHPLANALLAITEALGPDIQPANLQAIEAIYRRTLNDTSTAPIVAALAVGRWRAGDLAGARLAAERLRDSPFTDKDSLKLATKVLVALDKDASGASSEPAAPR